MRVGLAWRACHLRFHVAAGRRSISVSARLNNVPGTGVPPSQGDLSRTRNIGIIAHIDAGKTTTTERMLYYSGYTRRIGDVDEGSTVTDFLPAERARGITIQSAAITFHWPPPVEQPVQQPASNQTRKFNNPVEPVSLPRSSVPHNINLIDTPGHADFTFEVVRSLRILDGAVCILDGVAGVEAQTEKVWTQANHYQIPRIIYVNKLDRDGAAFGRTVREIGVRLHCWPAVCQVPWWKDGNGKLVGVGDAIGLRALRWQDGGDGKTVQVLSKRELSAENPKLVGEIKKARIALVELLSEHDEQMVEKFLEYGEEHLAIPASDITESLRKCVLQYPQRIVPVFAGASFRNIGVQPLLDAVVDLLPSPEERPDPEVHVGSCHGGLKDLLSGKIALAQDVAETPAKGKKAVAGRPDKNTVMLQNLEACALAFKVVNDARRGVLVYVRVYSGSLARNAALYNTNLHVTERAPRLLKMYASDAVEISAIPAGQIGVIVGLKHARTGDTLISYTGVNPKVGPPAPINSLQLRPINVPPPVFFTSVEPNSLAEEKHLSETLAILLREDPSLNVSLDPESGQTHLAGMGELHLEIARDRLINDFKAKAATGAIEISYREAILSATPPHTELVNREVAGKPSHASCTATVSPADVPASETSDHPNETIVQLDTNQLIIHHPTLTKSGLPVSSEQPSLPATLPFTAVVAALTSGVSAALARGPAHRYPIHSAQVNISFDHTRDVFADTTPAALSVAARQAVQAALKAASADGGSVLMEPVMMVTIAVPEGDLGSVVQDISSARGGQVLSLDGDTAVEDFESNGSSSSGAEEFGIVNPKNIYAPPDPFEGNMSGDHAYHDFGAGAGKQRQITARVPLKEMIGYLKHLRSLTGGRGTFVMTVDRFERMSAQRQKAVLSEMSGALA